MEKFFHLGFPLFFSFIMYSILVTANAVPHEEREEIEDDIIKQDGGLKAGKGLKDGNFILDFSR